MSLKKKCLITRIGCLIKLSDINTKILDNMCVTRTKKIGDKKIVKSIKLYKYVKINNIDYINYAIGVNLNSNSNSNSNLNLDLNLDLEYVNHNHNIKKLDINSEVELEDYQENYKNKILEVFKHEHFKSCLFVMDTGMGKTFVATSLISVLKTPTLIIIPNKSNIKGWKSAISMYLDLEIGEYHSDVKKLADIMIVTIDSSLTDIFNFGKIQMKKSEFFNRFGFVIYDEIHDYVTNTRHEIFWQTNFMYKLGLTATPDERQDEMDEVHMKHMKNIIRADKLTEIWKCNVNVIEYYGSPDYTEVILNNQGWLDVCKMQKQFSNDPYRKQYCENLIIDLYNKNRNIFVFAIHRQPLEEMINRISNKVSNISYFAGGNENITSDDVRIIFTTYGYGKQSISIPKMDTIVFLQPVKNKMRQIIGRITRKSGNTNIVREIYDIRDMNTKLKSQYSSRKLIYMEKNFNIIKTKIDYKNLLKNGDN